MGFTFPDESFADQWSRMSWLTGEVLFFPMETKPVDELSEFIGLPCVRCEDRVRSLGRYDEPVEDARLDQLMATDPIARRFYG